MSSRSGRIVHCSYHKCLTVYYLKVMSALYNYIFFLSGGYRHFNSRLDEFSHQSNGYRVASINNHAIDLAGMEDARISRFVRDPRDLIVSGYFYHKRGAEPWCHVESPTDEDWRNVHGHVPAAMTPGESYATYLQRVDLEQGLIAEIQFRRFHFESMSAWDDDDPRVRVWRYEDVMGNERAVFSDVLSFYGLSWPERRLGTLLADRFSARKAARSTRHIRNPTAGQWRQHFTSGVNEYFEARYGGLLDRYGYA